MVVTCKRRVLVGCWLAWYRYRKEGEEKKIIFSFTYAPPQQTCPVSILLLPACTRKSTKNAVPFRTGPSEAAHRCAALLESAVVFRTGGKRLPQSNSYFKRRSSLTLETQSEFSDCLSNAETKRQRHLAMVSWHELSFLSSHFPLITKIWTDSVLPRKRCDFWLSLTTLIALAAMALFPCEII